MNERVVGRLDNRILKLPGPNSSHEIKRSARKLRKTLRPDHHAFVRGVPHRDVGLPAPDGHYRGRKADYDKRQRSFPADSREHKCAYRAQSPEEPAARLRQMDAVTE